MQDASTMYGSTGNFSVCQHCGTKVNSDAKFCPYCGESVIITPPKAFCPSCGAELDSSGVCTVCAAPMQNIAAYNQAMEAGRNKKRKGRFILKIALITLLVLAVLAAVTFVYILPAVHYHKAENLLKDDNYFIAYTMYHDLGDYKDSEEKAENCAYMWADYILKQKSVVQANYFKNNVSLNSAIQDHIYASIWAEIETNTKIDYWTKNNAEAVYIMLQTLPSSYGDTTTLSKLFKAMSSGETYLASSYIRDNKSFLESIWSIEFIQDYLTCDDNMAVFLEDHWTTSGGGYYLTFTEDDDGSTYSNYDLPWVAQPAGTEFFDIKNSTYVWIDKNHKELAKVFRFTVNDFNTITVFCYKNNRSYKLYR